MLSRVRFGRESRALAVWAGCAIACAVAENSASASAPELFGFGSESGALVGAVSARTADFSAAFYNPAGLVRTRSAEFSVGAVAFASRLRINGVVQPITEPAGVIVGAAGPIPFGSWLRNRIFAGIALYIDPDALVRVINRAPSDPFFPYYDNRSQRLVVNAALAVRIGWGLSAGLTINYLAGLNGQVQASEGATRGIDPRVDEAIFSTVHVHAGLLWQSPSDRFGAALVYRQRFGVPFTTVTHNNIVGQPLDIGIDAEGLFTPDEIVVGGVARVIPGLRVSADLTASLWSKWRGPFVTVSSELPIVGALNAKVPQLAWRDTVSLRAGVEYERSVASFVSIAARGGYGFESSPAPAEQGGVTNALDGFKHFVGLGVGARFTHGPFVLRLDGHGQVHVMQEATIEKRLGAAGARPDPSQALPSDPMNPGQLSPDVTNPGWPRISGGGTVWAAGLTLTVQR